MQLCTCSLCQIMTRKYNIAHGLHNRRLQYYSAILKFPGVSWQAWFSATIINEGTLGCSARRITPNAKICMHPFHTVMVPFCVPNRALFLSKSGNIIFHRCFILSRQCTPLTSEMMISLMRHYRDYRWEERLIIFQEVMKIEYDEISIQFETPNWIPGNLYDFNINELLFRINPTNYTMCDNTEQM